MFITLRYSYFRELSNVYWAKESLVEKCGTYKLSIAETVLLEYFVIDHTVDLICEMHFVIKFSIL